MCRFKKLNNRRQPAGLERQILNTLAYVLIGGTLLPVYIALFTPMFFIPTLEEPLDKIIIDVVFGVLAW